MAEFDCTYIPLPIIPPCNMAKATTDLNPPPTISTLPKRTRPSEREKGGGGNQATTHKQTSKDTGKWVCGPMDFSPALSFRERGVLQLSERRFSGQEFFFKKRDTNCELRKHFFVLFTQLFFNLLGVASLFFSYTDTRHNKTLTLTH